MKLFEYHSAKDAANAQELHQKNTEASYIAGGTNLLDLMKKDIVAPSHLIDISRLAQKNIRLGNAGVTIGAFAINNEVADNETIIEKFSLLSKALLAGASPQLRNMATVGGNILQRTRCPYFYDKTLPCNKREPNSGCSMKEGLNRTAAIFGASENCVAVHPSDMCVALAALEAVVTVENQGKTRQINFKDFHRLPENTPEKDHNLEKSEMIMSIFIPNNAFAKNNYYLKIRDRASYAFALLSVATALDLDGDTIREARLAIGGVAHKPWRLYEVEAFLKGKKANETTFIEAAAMSSVGAKPLIHNAFKVKLLENGVQEALAKCMN
jgi:xanthine dehydrogenase YagS FAD-binding subunit